MSGKALPNHPTCLIFPPDQPDDYEVMILERVVENRTTLHKRCTKAELKELPGVQIVFSKEQAHLFRRKVDQGVKKGKATKREAMEQVLQEILVSAGNP